MARSEEPLNRENLGLVLGLYQSIAYDPEAWVTGKRKAPVARSFFNKIKSTRPARGRITRLICGYRITVQCEVVSDKTRTLALIRVSAPGWSVNLRGRAFSGSPGEAEYRISRVGEPFATGMHFDQATVQGLDRFKHQMTLITMLGEVEPLLPSYLATTW